jgi:hypothetical protein
MNVRPFMDFVREHRNGATHDECSDALQELVAAVTAANKAGKLTLTITIKPAGRDSGALEVGAEVKLSPPKAVPGVAIFFATPENNLQRQDPRQATLALRDIASPLHAQGVE